MQRFSLSVTVLLAMLAAALASPPAQAVLTPSLLEGVVGYEGGPSTLGTTVVNEAVIQFGDDLTNNNGPYTGRSELFLLVEATNHVTTAALNVEHDGSPGTNIDSGNWMAGVIPAGTPVHDYIIRHDSDNDATDDTSATFVFKGEIIGLNGGTNFGHNAFINQFGVAGANYAGDMDGTFDFGNNDVVVLISNDRHTLEITSRVGNSVSNPLAFDQLRVITTVPVPEPASAGLAALGLAALGLRLLRRAA